MASPSSLISETPSSNFAPIASPNRNLDNPTKPSDFPLDNPGDSGYVPGDTDISGGINDSIMFGDSDALEVSDTGLAERSKTSHISLPPLQGAWKKPLSISKLMTSEDLCSEFPTGAPSSSQWPSLSGGQKLTKRQRQEKSKNKVTKNDQPLDDLIEDNNVVQRFPFAAKMNPTTRNLYRTTSPTYMADGTPKVQIPNHVLLKGLENQKEFVIGQFYRCSTPSGGLIHALVNKMWGRNCKIFIRKLGESSYMFHIPNESTRTWVIQRGLWHIDDCLMFVAPWSPAATLALPEISTMPVWVTLKNIPSQLYSIQGISWIASGLGAPMATNKPRLDPTLMGEAKILVEVELNKPFPQRIAAEDKKGTISMIDVEYSWLPSKCGRCGQLGHKESRCLEHKQVVVVSPIVDTQKTPLVSESSPCRTTTEVNVVVLPTTSPIANVVVSSDTSLENTSIEEVAMPLMGIVTACEETSKEDHEASQLVVEATPIIEALVTSSNITSSPQFLAPSGNMTIPLVVESNACGFMLNEDGSLSTPESSDTDVDLMALSSQRILRERPVQPSLKYHENEWISISTSRRGKRGRRGRR